MAIVMEPNHSDDDDDYRGVYIPTLLDSSIPVILAHRGVPAERIMKLVADLDSPCPMAEIEMRQLLPSTGNYGVGGVAYEHGFEVLLTPTTRWTGRRLTTRLTLPETMRNALVGRGLREVVDHPALPNRRILSVEEKGEDIVIHVEGDAVPVVELSGAPDSILHGAPARNAQRRRWIVSHLGDYHTDSDWSWFTDKVRQEAVDDLGNGVERQHGPLCWGEPHPSMPRKAAAAVTVGARPVKRWFARLLEGPSARAA
jgi:hypothetical protein